MQFFEHKIVSVEDLIPYALNSRTHSDAQRHSLPPASASLASPTRCWLTMQTT